MYPAVANSPATQTVGALESSGTTVEVQDQSVVPEPPFLLTFGFDHSESETVLVTAKASTTLTIVRGIDGGPFEWPAGTKCARIFTAKDLNDIQANFEEVLKGIGDAKAAGALIVCKMMQREDDIENLLQQATVQTVQKTLTNSLKFPFNNSQVTVPLPREVSNANYVVNTEVVSHNGNIGEVIVSDKLVNGFKLAFTGSASQVVVKCVIMGGTI